ncbi:hypothetical protein FXO38_11435 [Capsicum annuum]|nr:hypothetical protein FXO38_11435 [Capsicum annuum]
MFVAAFLTFMSIGGFPSFVEDMKGVMILSGGFFRLPHDLPKPFWKFPMYYIAFHKYVYQGFYKNEFLGLTFPNEQIGGPSMISGDEVLRSVWQVEMGGCCNSFWDATSGLIAKTSKSCVYFVVMDQITLQRRLHTRDRLKKWNVTDQSLYTLCGMQDESVDHLFFKCGFCAAIWDKLLSWRNCARAPM